LVGPDEADPAQGRLNFQSPLGRALTGKRQGDRVVVQRPLGALEVTVKDVRYEPA